MQSLSLLMLIICSYTDLKERGISIRVLTAFLTVSSGLIFTAYIYGNRFERLNDLMLYDLSRENIIMSLVPGLILLLISFFTKEAIGRGDVYVICLLGLMIGFDMIFRVLFISMIICAVVGLICMALKGMKKKDTLPFIPFLLGAYVIFILLYNTGGA